MRRPSGPSTPRSFDRFCMFLGNRTVGPGQAAHGLASARRGNRSSTRCCLALRDAAQLVSSSSDNLYCFTIVLCLGIDYLMWIPHTGNGAVGDQSRFLPSPRICSSLHRHERGKPVAFLAEQGECRLLIPLLVRPIDPAIALERNILYDASSPYGYPCPLLSLSDHDDSENFLRLGLAAFLDGLREALHRVGVCPTPPAHRSTGGTAY